METDYVQVYSLSNITQRTPNVFVDKRLAVIEICPKHNEYFVIGKPYQFMNLGLIVITAGTCQITINLEPRQVKVGDILIVMPNQFFEIKSFSEDFAVKTIFVDSQLMVEGSFHFKSKELINVLSSKFPQVVTPNKQVLREIQFHMNKLRKYSRKTSNSFAEQLVFHHFSILLYEIANIYDKIITKNKVVKKVRGEEIVKEFLLLVYAHFKQERNIEFYSDKMNISRKHLTKTIKELVNKTPKQLISDAVIIEAKILLKNPKLSISDVVTELNFSDLAIFSKYFKIHTNYSPLQYKKMMQ